MMQEILKIADIHANRIKMALEELCDRLPFSAEKVENFTNQDILLTELLVNRFAKLQDLMGAKIFPLFLTKVGENIDGLTMIDKLNLLERLNIIESVELWIDMRKARNSASHEYPDEFVLIAEHLNDVVFFVPKLLEILEKIISNSG